MDKKKMTKPPSPYAQYQKLPPAEQSQYRNLRQSSLTHKATMEWLARWRMEKDSK